MDRYKKRKQNVRVGQKHMCFFDRNPHSSPHNMSGAILWACPKRPLAHEITLVGTGAIQRSSIYQGIPTKRHFTQARPKLGFPPSYLQLTPRPLRWDAVYQSLCDFTIKQYCQNRTDISFFLGFQDSRARSILSKGQFFHGKG